MEIICKIICQLGINKKNYYQNNNKYTKNKISTVLKYLLVLLVLLFQKKKPNLTYIRTNKIYLLNLTKIL